MTPAGSGYLALTHAADRYLAALALLACAPPLLWAPARAIGSW